MGEEKEVGTLQVYGKQVMCRRDHKTEVKSLALPETPKGRYAIANV